jgi:hypothetical protein
MVASADAAQFESECLDQPAEFGETDIAQITRSQQLPQISSAGVWHAGSS